jgi:Ca-activated chloride channel homolog
MAAMSLRLVLAPPLLAIPPRPTPQLCYALLTIAADAGGGAAPVNWAILADASRSMRIPIVSEEQFRELVRAGGAQEVLVDGVPVWQLAGPVPEAVRAAAPSALDHTARALGSVIERLDRADRLCLVACAERAELLVAAGGERRGELVAGVARLRAAGLGDETDLAAGMALALQELRRGDGVSRLILLTDGFTRDAAACLAHARAAAAAGVSISTLGLGGEFQDDLLTQIADLTGGRATLVRRAEQIPAVVAAELDAARGVSARALTLRVALPRGAALRHATRLSPALAPLEWAAEGERVALLRLGDLERGAPVRLLLEILAPPEPPRPPPGGALLRLAALEAASGAARAGADLVARYTPAADAPPPAILDAAARASAVRLQRRAAEAVARGESESAAQLLRAAAARLQELGEPELAAAALREAATLAATGRGSGLGARELTYATRRLGAHELESDL